MGVMLTTKKNETSPESNEKMIMKNRKKINQLARGGFESRDLKQKPDGAMGPSIVKTGKKKSEIKVPGGIRKGPFKGPL